MTTLLCDDCAYICEAAELTVSFPDIPNLLERVSPGEPVPYGECPKCGALMHAPTPVKGKRAFIDLGNGKFLVTCPFGNGKYTPDFISDDPKAVRAFLIRECVDDISCSSSIDFPEEYGVSEEKVTQLLGKEVD